MEKLDYTSKTSQTVIDYLKDKGIDLTREDMTFIRVTINTETNSAWEEGTRSNGCDCGQMGCPICTP